MIRFSIPIDIQTVAATASEAFALATPLRVDQLVALAIGEAIGFRAPADKRERSIRRVLAGLHARDFVVEVDGRIYERLDAIAVCSGTITLRFFSNERHGPRLPAS